MATALICSVFLPGHNVGNMERQSRYGSALCRGRIAVSSAAQWEQGFRAYLVIVFYHFVPAGAYHNTFFQSLAFLDRR